jgi:hypothetical protein
MCDRYTVHEKNDKVCENDMCPSNKNRHNTKNNNTRSSYGKSQAKSCANCYIKVI